MKQRLLAVCLRISLLLPIVLAIQSKAFAVVQQPSTQNPAPRTPTPSPLGTTTTSAPPSAAETPKFDPARFVSIYEQAGTKEILLYDPTLAPSRQMKADIGSVLVIKVNLTATPDNTLISNLYMSARLGGEKAVSVPVVGYSELGVAKETAGSQTAVSSQTVEDIRQNVSTIYWTSREILESVYGPDCINAMAASPQLALNQPACNTPRQVVAGQPGAPADFDTRVAVAFRLHKAEIETIAGALIDPKQVEIARVIGNSIFGLSASTMIAAATEYRKDFDALTVGTPPNQAAATRLLERTKMILRDLCIDVPMCNDANNLERSLVARQADVLAKLRTLVVDGQVFLAETKAKDGDTLKLRIESISKGAGGGTAAAEFEVNLRNFGAKAFLSPSIFFITRASVNEADLDRVVPGYDANGAPISVKNPIKALSGSPFPGMTFGVVSYHRGFTSASGRTLTRTTAFDKLRSALAPGIGVNVTFMSFDDPRDFDPAGNEFTKTSGSNFQIGAGPAVSLFNNALQFTYGFNLNESQKRRYFGFGFGFIEIGKALSGYLKKS